jgi:hypothetical protein
MANTAKTSPIDDVPEDFMYNLVLEELKNDDPSPIQLNTSDLVIDSVVKYERSVFELL